MPKGISDSVVNQELVHSQQVVVTQLLQWLLEKLDSWEIIRALDRVSWLFYFKVVNLGIVVAREV